jgi:hypothetical protein
MPNLPRPIMNGNLVIREKPVDSIASWCGVEQSGQLSGLPSPDPIRCVLKTVTSGLSARKAGSSQDPNRAQMSSASRCGDCALRVLALSEFHLLLLLSAS